jgi:glycosyltransferase involved in cell wall biosynthesis
MERLEYYKNESNLGLAGNWNQCISLSRGQWIHILHQDDLIYPGFYAAMRKGVEKAQHIGMAYCRNETLEGDVKSSAEAEMNEAGILENWLERLAINQRIQCPGVVVRREVYKNLGGFSADFSYALDWEMWARIARDYAVWYEPRLLSCYRIHADNETSRLKQIGVTLDDEYAAARKIASYLSADARRRIWPLARRSISTRAMKTAARLMHGGMRKQGMKMFRKALWLNPGLWFTSAPLSYLKWDMKLIVNNIFRVK